MAKDETKPISPGILQEDAAVVATLKGMADYAPANADFAVAKLTVADTALNDANTAFTQAEGAYQAARDRMVARGGPQSSNHRARFLS